MRTAVDAGDPVAQNTAWCYAELGDMYFKTGKLNEATSSLRLGPGSVPLACIVR